MWVTNTFCAISKCSIPIQLNSIHCNASFVVPSTTRIPWLDNILSIIKDNQSLNCRIIEQHVLANNRTLYAMENYECKEKGTPMNLPSRLGLSRARLATAVTLRQLCLALDRVLLVRCQVYHSTTNWKDKYIFNFIQMVFFAFAKHLISTHHHNSCFVPLSCSCPSSSGRTKIRASFSSPADRFRCKYSGSNKY